MKYPITINGKEYEFAVNRNALKKINFNKQDSGNLADSIDLLEDMFYAFISVKQPMSREEAMELLDQAEEEYGFKYLSEALGQIASEGFTLNGKSTIAWVKQAE